MAIDTNYPFKLVMGSCYIASATDIEFGPEVNPVDATCAGTYPYAATVGGLASLALHVQGYHDFSTLLSTSTAERLRGLTGTVVRVSCVPRGDAAGNLAVFTTGLIQSTKSITAKLGELPSLDVQVQARGVPIVEGFESADALTDRTASFTGSNAQLGAVSASQRVYANFHILDTTGSGGGLSVTPRIESDTTGFPSPTTIVTGSAMSAIGDQTLVANGPFTDDFFRIGVTIAGTTPHVTLLAVVGVATVQ